MVLNTVSTILRNGFVSLLSVLLLGLSLREKPFLTFLGEKLLLASLLTSMSEVPCIIPIIL